MEKTAGLHKTHPTGSVQKTTSHGYYLLHKQSTYSAAAPGAKK